MAPGGREREKGLAVMKVGVPKELKNHEYRVAITPAGVHELSVRAIRCSSKQNAGTGSAIPDADFVAAGADHPPTADEVWAASDLVLKVKEPVPEEYHRMRKDQVLFTYLHLAASRQCTDALLGSGITSIAYETVQAGRRVRCRCSRPCPRSPAGWHRRSGRTTCSATAAAAACSWAGCPASTRPRWWSSARACPG